MLVVAPFTPRLSVRLRRGSHGHGGHVVDRNGPDDVQPPDAAHVVRDRCAVRRAADHWHRAVDVADDGVDHVGDACGLEPARR